jgi:hypothetical protein
MTRTDGGMNILPIFCNIKRVKHSYLHEFCSGKYDSGTVGFRFLILLTLCMDYVRISFCVGKGTVFPKVEHVKGGMII